MRDNSDRIEFDNHRCTISFPEAKEFRMERKPDFAFVTRSPDFTPEAADPLYDLAKLYIDGS